MITLISTPARVNPDDPADICRWIATESPNNFRLQRSDFVPIAVGATSGGYLGITPPADFSGAEGDSIVVVDDLGNTYTGEITDMPGADYDVETDIVYSLTEAVGEFLILIYTHMHRCDAIATRHSGENFA